MAKRRHAIYNLALLVLALGVTIGCGGTPKEPPKGATATDAAAPPEVSMPAESSTDASPAKETPAGAPDSTSKP